MRTTKTLLLLLTATLFGLASSQAVTLTWIGNATNNNWGSALNWGPTTTGGPTAGEDILFNGTGTRQTSTVQGAVTYSINSMTFASTATVAYNLTQTNVGNLLSIGAGGITWQAGTAAHTIEMDEPLGLALSASQVWDNQSSNLQYFGISNINLNGNNLTFQANSAGSFNQGTNAGGVISGSGNLTLASNTGARMGFGGANTFTGTVFVNGATAELRNDAALGNAANVVQLNSGTLRVQSGQGSGADQALTIANAIQITGANVSLFVDDGVATADITHTYSGNISFTTTGTLNLRSNNDATATSNMIVSGNITDSGGNIGSLIVTSSGVNDPSTFTLQGVNTYRGDTTVNLGTLILADNSQMTFVIGADGVNNSILGGTGTGILNLDGDFVFDLSGAAAVGSWMIVEHADLTETYGATFSVVGFTDAGSGVWTSGNYTFTENTGMLTAVPEPTTWALLGASLTCVVLLRARRRTS